jgi:aminopeptidase N
MMRWTARIAMCIGCSAVLSPGAAPLSRPFTVENYEVSIQPDLANQRLYGEVTIRFHSHADTPVSALELDAGGLQIANVLDGGAQQSFEQNHGKLFVVLTNPARLDQQRTITVRYQAGPAPGLKFFPDEIYTTVTSDWMPCNDVPGERATLHLTITAPPHAKTAASGRLTASRESAGNSVTEWQLDSSAEPSLFGFAVGNFSENTSDADGVKLRLLGAGTQIFEPTEAAMHYFADRSGKHYPGETYTQVFVHGDAIRSMKGGLTLLPESYAQGLLKQPDNLWPLASALAHQWYGLGIATKDWSDLWLSEGVSAFLADAFLGQRFGKERYEREMAQSRQVFEQLRAEGRDRPLSDTAWTTRPQAESNISIHKGAWFLHLLSQMEGDNAFWNGLRLYTSDQWGQAATSEDFQRAFDAVSAGGRGADRKGGAPGRRSQPKSSPKSLDNLFDMWVYGVTDTKSK